MTINDHKCPAVTFNDLDDPNFNHEKAVLSFEIQMILSIYSLFNKRFTSLVLVLPELLLSMAYFVLIRYVTVK